MMYNYGYYQPHMFGFGPIAMVIFWVVAIWVIIYLIRKFMLGHKTDHRGDSVVDILKKRYAKGEITREQFESMKKDLE